MDKKKAFTLAEVLITLGIIGIVAAITLPQLINSYKKQVTVEKLKTTYSILSQAIEQSKEANGDIDTWNTSLSNIDFAKLYILPYIKTISTITTYRSNNFPHLYTLSNQYDSHSPFLFWTWNLTNTPIYVMENGIWLVTQCNSQNSMWITVDINGKNNPNVMGIDGFAFIIDTKTNQLLPYGYGKTRDDLTTKNTSFNGACIRDNSWQYYRGGSCAALIMMDGWKISEDYPWGNGGLTPIPKE